MDQGSGFEFVEGATSDLTFEVRGPTLEAVFVEAARAFLAATVEDPDSVDRRVARVIVLEEPDVDLLLLGFLNELVYLRDAEDLLLHPQRIELLENGASRLRARLVGERIDRDRHRLETDVKAATAHELHVTNTAGTWTARVTLDV